MEPRKDEDASERARQLADDDQRGASTSWNRSGYVTGLYRSPKDAERAYDSLTSKHGYAPTDVDVLMSDATRQRHYPNATAGQELKEGSKAMEGLGVGSAVGGGVGATLAAIFAVGSNVVVPGIGLVVAGPIAAALAGAGAGGATGGIIGALIGAGIPEERAREYDQGVREGGVVIGAKARDEAHAAELEREYNTFGGTSILR
jgi:hypothetical protein